MSSPPAARRGTPPAEEYESRTRDWPVYPHTGDRNKVRDDVSVSTVEPSGARQSVRNVVWSVTVHVWPVPEHGLPAGVGPFAHVVAAERMAARLVVPAETLKFIGEDDDAFVAKVSY